jgi:hypothetical protein
MNDPALWSHDQDPPRDDALARQLRAADGAAPGQDVDWERLRTAIMRGAARAGGPAARLPPGEWWDVVVRWRQVAAAASVAAMLAAGALVWRSGGGAEEFAVGDDTAPESVALARVVAAYPDDAVLVSLLETARNDEFTSWGDR